MHQSLARIALHQSERGSYLYSRFIPKRTLDSVRSLDLDELCRMGIRGIIFDIDNTLESHRTPLPGKETNDLIARAREAGLTVCLISNGKRERVARFNEPLRLPAVGKAQKPRKKNLRRAMRLLGTTPAETALVGDQLFTDIYGGNRMGFYTVLVEPIEQIENKFFYIKRFFERQILKKIKE